MLFGMGLALVVALIIVGFNDLGAVMWWVIASVGLFMVAVIAALALVSMNIYDDDDDDNDYGMGV